MNFDDLEKKAREATCFLEVFRYYHGGGRVFKSGTNRDEKFLIADFYDEENREYYLAADPVTILALIDENKRLKLACDIFEKNSADAVEVDNAIRRTIVIADDTLACPPTDNETWKYRVGHGVSVLRALLEKKK